MEISIFILLLALSMFGSLCRGSPDPVTEAAAQLPGCGLSCILGSVPSSDCGSIQNITCLCADDVFHGAVLQCVQDSCMPLEAIETARFEADICHRPPRSRKRDLLGILAVEIPAFFSVLLRLYSRWHINYSFALDDYLMLVVAVLYIPFEALGQIAGSLAFGVDIWDVDPDDLTYALELFYATESFYLAIVALTKLSVLCFYLRVFPNQGFRRLTYVVMTWVAVSGMVLVLLQILQCIPIEYSWEGWKDGGGAAGLGGAGGGGHRCLQVNALAFTAAGINIAQDLVILVMPLPLLARLQAPWRVRLGVMLMFSLGAFVLVTSCARLRSIVLFARSANLTWDYTDAMVWTGLECAVSMIVTSLPAVRALVSRLRPGAFGSEAAPASSRGHSRFPSSSTAGATIKPSLARSPPGSPPGRGGTDVEGGSGHGSEMTENRAVDDRYGRTAETAGRTLGPQISKWEA